MYLTKVLVGEYKVGRQGLLTPPAKNPSDPTDIYDSVVGFLTRESLSCFTTGNVIPST